MTKLKPPVSSDDEVGIAGTPSEAPNLSFFDSLSSVAVWQARTTVRFASPRQSYWYWFHTFTPLNGRRKKLSSAVSQCRGEERREKGLGFSGPFDLIQTLTLTVKYKVSINERLGFNILRWTAEIPVMDIPVMDRRISVDTCPTIECTKHCASLWLSFFFSLCFLNNHDDSRPSQPRFFDTCTSHKYYVLNWLSTIT